MYEILQDRGLVEVSGADSLKFLQGLITNDIIKHDYCYSYMLSNQGRYLFDFFILKISDNHFLIDISLKQLSSFITKLMMYKLRASVNLVDKTKEYNVLYSKEAITQSGVVASNKDTRYEQLGFRSVISKDMGLHQDKLNMYLEDKYNFAIPDGDVDLIYDKSIPVEFGAEELNAIDYQKGCYIGQELISRTKYQGVVRKKIFKIEVYGNLENNNRWIATLATSKDIRLCSSYRNLGIALINEEKYFELIKNSIFLGDVEVVLSIPSWREKL